MASSEGLEGRVRFLTIWAALATLGLLVLGVMVFRLMQTSAVLRAERIEVVESDGRPSMIIANSRRIPGPVLDGRELPRELSQGRIGSAGIIFFSPRGDEIGGLTYRLEESESGHQATSGLMFDQYRQDQVVGLQYSDSGSNRMAGLQVWDRSPEVHLADLVDLIQASRQEGVAAEKAKQELQERAKRGELGAQRIFVGSRNRVASVVLRDTQGRPRIRLAVDDNDTPFLEFLNPDGESLLRLPQPE